MDCSQPLPPSSGVRSSLGQGLGPKNESEICNGCLTPQVYANQSCQVGGAGSGLKCVCFCFMHCSIISQSELKNSTLMQKQAPSIAASYPDRMVAG